MARFSSYFRRLFLVVMLLAGAGSSFMLAGNGTGSAPPPRAYIVQAVSTDRAAAAVTQAGGTVTTRLVIINGVAAQLDGAALGRLQRQPGIVLHADGAVRPVDDSGETYTTGLTLYPSVTSQAAIMQNLSIQGPRIQCGHQQVTVDSRQEGKQLRGWGVTVAVIDSGFPTMAGANPWPNRDRVTGALEMEGGGRCIVYRDFVPRSVANGNSGTAANNSVDQNGHATHVLSTIADNRAVQLAPRIPNMPVGAAPLANLLVARALDGTGAGTYSQVIAAIDWIVANQAQYNVRVLNLSLYAPVSDPYWNDPLDQAVMRAWQAGITVVAAAGNSGPGAGTITVPGNVPYVITVGALTSGRYTRSGSDELASYSSRGPTESAFVKPDVIIPATRSIAPMPDAAVLSALVLAGRIQASGVNPSFGIGNVAGSYSYYQLSGTSMAAAEVSGVAALILQANPTLTNDQVKYRILSTAHMESDSTTGQPIYTVWEQGAGLLDAPAAVFTNTLGAANVGMDINQDLTTNTHYWGYTTWDPATGTFHLIDPRTGQTVVLGGAGQIWAGAGQAWAGAGQAWAGAGQAWAGAGQAWAGAGQIWAGGVRTWPTDQSLWAGAGQIWAGSVPATSLSTATSANILLDVP
jgi:serine protease AprX